MQHAWERRGKCTGFWWESPDEGDQEDGTIRMDVREIGWGEGGGVDSTGSG
jgi:hypothetical protein